MMEDMFSQEHEGGRQLIAVEPLKLFYCYVPQDKKLRDELEKHLIMLKRLGQITLRLNREIVAGTNWGHVEDRRFQSADLILLLISPDFMYSDYHYGIEMRHALEKHEARNVWVIPIILRPTPLWEQSPIGKFQVLPKDGKAITERRNRDAAFTDVVKGISEVVAILLARKQELAFATKAGEGEFSKFTQVIGPLCITCGARNPLGVITCENCGDLLFTNAAKSSQEVHSLHPSSGGVAEMPFLSNPAMPDLTDKSQSPTKASEKGVFVCPNCGTNNPPDEQFCSNCGAYLASSTADAPVVTNVNPGGEMKECPNCKAENRDDASFCINCGRSLAGVPPAPTTTTGGRTGGARSLSVGSRLQGGRYIVKKVLGEGGMGAALLATDNRLDNKLVVIKELISDNTDPSRLQDDVRNFKQEVATLAHIDHPLIPNVADHFQEGTRYFMVQEYVEGETLEERMDKTNQPMKEREVLGYASQVLDVLDYLEQETPPIVHRDIKPTNIIIGERDKQAHLVDFGIAHAYYEVRNAKWKQTAALGTPGYAPPEQYLGNADPRSDLYALAATLHYLLTNQDPRNHPPFVYPPVRALNPQLSPEIERVLSRALTNDINHRYQSAAQMKQDVDEILLKRFGASGNTSTYILGTSGPTGTTGTQTAAGGSSPPPNTPTSPSSPPQHIMNLFKRIMNPFNKG
jgi:serine/threonine protein kinase/ribosomal protein L40E